MEYCYKKPEMNYKTYLRNWGVYSQEEIDSYKVEEVKLPEISNSELCSTNFKSGHKWIFGGKWIFAHSIGDIREPYQPTVSNNKK